MGMLDKVKDNKGLAGIITTLLVIGSIIFGYVQNGCYKVEPVKLGETISIEPVKAGTVNPVIVKDAKSEKKATK